MNKTKLKVAGFLAIVIIIWLVGAKFGCFFGSIIGAIIGIVAGPLGVFLCEVVGIIIEYAIRA